MTLRVSFEEASQLTGHLKHNAYCAADCAGTLEIAKKLLPRLRGSTAATYAFERACQNPAFAMMRRGIKVDTEERKRVLAALDAEIEQALAAVAAMPQVVSVWDGAIKETGECPKSKRKDSKHSWSKPSEAGQGQARLGKARQGEDLEAERFCTQCGASRFRPEPFNANSSAQVAHLLYDLLGIPPQKNRQGNVSADEEVLQRIARKWPRWAPLIGWEPDEKLGREGRGILHARALKKQAGFVKSRLTDEGRFMFSMSVGATWTGRWSSSTNPQGLGGNIQTVSERHRGMFIPDPGFELAYADLMRAESMLVAYLAEDEAYIEAHKTDTHTYVARLLWPELPWTGDIEQDSVVARANPAWDSAPGHNYRFQAKRVQHGSCPDYVEVLTEQGWASMGAVDDSAPIAIWSEDATIRWEIPTRWTRWEFDGDLVCFSGRRMCQDVTPNHRMPLLNNGGRMYERQASTFPVLYGRAPVNGWLNVGVDGSEAEARLLAATWADGSLPNQGRTRQTTFSFRKTRKIIRLRALLAECGLAWDERKYDGKRVTFVVYKKLRKSLGWDMLKWKPSVRQAFLAELPLWDGCTSGGQLRVMNNDRSGMEIIQTLAHLTALSANINTHGKPKSNWGQTWILSLAKAQAQDYAHAIVQRRPYCGRVHSPTVSTGWYLVRQNGVISITGNSNYGLSPQGIAMWAHIPRKAAQAAQEAYLTAFPGIQGTFQARVRERVRQQLPLITPTGRVIQLMGRPWDESTAKQGFAAVPQGTVADLVNIALCRVYREHDPELLLVLANIHDAGLLEWKIEHRDVALKAVVDAMTIPMLINGRTCVIPVEIAVGSSWAKRDLKSLWPV